MIKSAWHDSRALIGAALAAHLMVSVLIVFTSAVPLFIAMAATASFAATWLLVKRNARATNLLVSFNIWRCFYQFAFTITIVVLGGWIVSALIGNANAFYCESAIPWRIEIALFGSCVVGFSTRMIHKRENFLWGYPLSVLTLFWIAPFYGYFSGAIFLGTSILSDCPNRSIVQICVTGLVMVVGSNLGRILAHYLLKGHRE